MAVTRESSKIQVFYGLAADAKPNSTAIGSKFSEMDTGKVFIWTGAAWVEDLRFGYTKTSA
jgi:hypothetical protein